MRLPHRRDAEMRGYYHPLKVGCVRRRETKRLNMSLGSGKDDRWRADQDKEKA